MIAPQIEIHNNIHMFFFPHALNVVSECSVAHVACAKV